MNKLEFYLNNGGKYSFIPRREKLSKSIFISTSTKYFDPIRGQRVIEDFLDNMVLGEQLGFDGLLVLEQHGGPNAVTGQSIVMTSALAARTKNIRVGAVGPIMNTYLSPMRYAEEVAALDYLSRGRFFFGMPVGIGPNYHALGIDPTRARERLREGHDLMKKAFMEEGPFEWDGKFFKVPYANLWPKPLQKPHPEIWVPAVGSKDSLKFAADNHYTYLAILVPRPVLLRNIKTFRDMCEEAGYTADPTQVVATATVHVAETDKQARLEVEAHFMSMLQNSFGSPFHDSFPPGHVTSQSLRGMMSGGYRAKEISETTFEEAVADRSIICGSPDTVAEQIEELTSAMGAGRLVVNCDGWTAPAWLTRKNMTIFAEEVIPRFRAPGGKPIWDNNNSQAWNTTSEYGARVEEPLARPTVRLADSGVVDIRTAHIEELRKPLEP
ncbi:LLM class flavin-dependent oxidoreductase [Rhizobium pusense]|uniref:LLM class flavin-dependent oxidoreductase n=2 Tax=Agrobacterium TaxID=357 RepID=A0A6H0ZGN0_9HYPH|nr:MULTISPECIES: LLM class flavin-dependent oxidoreductase [Rhizobium/Agrobacterium group]QCM13583.1 LLM class flavin-dependent oxidoreductase [Agrobacterium tumefaciens]KNY31471.1 hypothetical protein AKG12_24055 [Agrobacterium sp. SUL3]MCD4663562.1 LLM class flavin-dependent oxidoreductase [Agrobacterium sp.]MDH0872709.1 LLM class flavin-dependent oxidoreductase [Agrobacterium pusense]MDH0912503.1 LLM class flavin-dependent oxidoreductase [Agrobacterium pusense]